MRAPTSRSSAITADPPSGSPCLTCRPAASAAEKAEHFRIRYQVFVVEQGLFGGNPAGPSGSQSGTERDCHDASPATVHAVGLVDAIVCGTVRFYPLDSGGHRWHGDRLAVLAEHRHRGLGAPLVRFAVGQAAARGGHEMDAFIQLSNVTFFEWLGWHRVGGPVTYAGIDHQQMLISFAAKPYPGQHGL